MENSYTTMKKNIAGVVVLYNPGKDVVGNIQSYIDWISYLYIIDNSENSNSFIKEAFSGNTKVEYIYNNNNIGIAAALNIAVEKAVKSGYNFLLTMDQDSVFEEGSLKSLFMILTDSSSIGIYSPFHKNRFFTSPPRTAGMEEVSDVMTSGNILNLSAVSKAGKFKEEYFIDFVDVEYCFRLRKNGFKIMRVNNSFLIHNEANLSKRKFFGFSIYPSNHSDIRWYYKIRNYLYTKKEYQKYFEDYFVDKKKYVLNNILKVLFFEKRKIKKFKMMFKGYNHFHKNILGKLSA